MTYTLEQIEDAVENWEEYWSEELEESLYTDEERAMDSKYRIGVPEGWSDMDYGTFIVIDGQRVDYEFLESTGGPEQGSYTSVVFRIGDRYFKKEGYYASHYGNDWDGDFYEVVPTQVTVTKYVKAGGAV